MDLDGDGINDVISGSWPGELFFFRGRGHGQFEGGAKLKDKTGKTINIGGGVQRNDENEVLVAGDATFETRDGKQFIVYEDQSIDTTGKTGGITGTASVVHAADLDGDGDLDLLVGDIGGNVYFVPNEGTAKAWAFGAHQPLRAENGAVKVEGDAGPFVGDWDGDGKPDLLVGSGDGSVQLYRNTGRVDPQTKLPIYETPRALITKAPQPQYDETAPPEPTRGIRTKVCVADWNGDGRPDLLVGDYATMKPNLPDLTPEQKAEQDQLRAKVKALEPRYQQASEKYFDTRGKQMTPAEREKDEKEFAELSNEMQQLRAKLPPAYESHGWVWLYLRKPPDQARAGG